jgi:hypothetical protein
MQEAVQQLQWEGKSSAWINSKVQEEAWFILAVYPDTVTEDFANNTWFLGSQLTKLEALNDLSSLHLSISSFGNLVYLVRHSPDPYALRAKQQLQRLTAML